MEEESASTANAHHETHEHHHKEEKQKFDIMKYKKHVAVTLVYLVVALVMFYPITMHLGTVAPGSGADTYQNLWDIWWVKYAVFHLHSNAFYTNLLFWPLGAGLAYQTLSPGLGLVSAPFQALGGTVFGYNIIFFAGFALSGLTMFILADYLTKNNYAALISGFIFAFSAFHIAQSYSHIHFTNLEFIPLFIYFFLKVMNEKRSYLNIVGMSASFAFTTVFGNIEQTIMLLIAFVILIVIYLFIRDSRKKLLSKSFVLSFVLFLILAFIIGSWNFIPLLKGITQQGGLGIANYLNSAQNNIEWSASPLAFFVPSYYNGLIFMSKVPTSIYNSIYAPDPVEKVAYIGYAVLALMLYGVYKYRKEMLPWAVCAIIFAWLAMGPTFGLYSIYHALPAINVVREPGRFDMIASLFIAILGAFGAKALFEKLSEHHSHENKQGNATKLMAVAIIILAIMFIENNGLAFGRTSFTTQITVPSLYKEIGQVPGNFSVLELPAIPAGANNTYLYEGEATYYTSITHKPLVGGYLGGRQNSSTTLLLYNIPLVVEAYYLQANGTPNYISPVTENYTNQTLLTLYNYNTEFVTVHDNAYNESEFEALGTYMEKTFGAPIYNNDSVTAFETENAINRTLFRNYVSYPSFEQWDPYSVFVNGTNQNYWVPSAAGSIIVYAPYLATVSNETKNVSYSSQYINTTIRFSAYSQLQQILYIAEPISNNSTRTIAKIELSSKPTIYEFNTTMISGPAGNPLLFLYQNSTAPILINNITFSKSKTQ